MSDPPETSPPERQEPELPAPMTLGAMQAYVAMSVRARGFTEDLNEVFILLTEELGELARELRPPPRSGPGADSPERDAKRRENLAYELADMLLYLLDVANGLEAELTALWPARERELAGRFAGGAALEPPFDPGWGLNRLVARVEQARLAWGFEDGPLELLAGLTEEVGEIANELRKRWKGLSGAEQAGREVLDALHYVLRLAHVLGVDLEAAVREKEAHNAGRIWDY